MINKYYLTFMLLLLGTVLSSCGSDDDGMDSVKPVTPPASGTSWTVDVVAETTRGLSVSGNVLTQSWSTTDKIFVYYKNQKVGVLHPATNVAGVVKLLGNIDTPATPYIQDEMLYFYYGRDKGFSDYSGQDGTLEKIASDYDYATAQASITKVNANERKLTVALASFQPQQAIVKFTFKRGDDAAATKPNQDVNEITISTVATGNIGDGITVKPSSARNELYIALPVSSSATAEEYFINAKVGTNPDFVGKLPSKALQNGKYYTSEVRLYEAVQLWKDGPMWAKNNLRTSSDRYSTANGYYDPYGGNYFCWAGKDGRSHSTYIFNTSDKLHPEYCPYYSTSGYTKYNNTDKIPQLQSADDAATLNWGQACRIPTNAEFDALKDNNNTTVSWSSSGATFTGKGAYSGKSITLPAIGFLTNSDVIENGICHYWSSSMILVTDEKTGITYPYGGGLRAESASSCGTASWSARHYGKPIRPIIPWKGQN